MIQAIETHYAGCRFRSRLEARWAVFFNHLGIEWEYEPEGFQTEDRSYLPDFRLTWRNHNREIRNTCWVEVKGTDTQIDQRYRETLGQLIDYGGPLANGILLLGPIPDPNDYSEILWHYAHHYKGVVVTPRAITAHGLAEPNWVLALHDEHHDQGCLPAAASWDPTPIRVQTDRVWWQMHAPICAAYNKARQARFEHGEQP